MSIQPPTAQQLRRLYAGNPTFDVIEDGLRAAGVYDTVTAAAAMAVHPRRVDLTSREVAGIVARFAPLEAGDRVASKATGRAGTLVRLTGMASAVVQFDDSVRDGSGTCDLSSLRRLAPKKR